MLKLDRGEAGRRGKSYFDVFFTFFGSQTSFFFLTTASQPEQRKRPGFGLALDLPLRQLMTYK